MKKITLSLILILNVIYLFSQERRVITTAVPFLMISADARASGLGEQGVATSPDAFSQHWNPAKYVFLDNASGVGVSYTPYLSKLVSDVFLANINYYNIINERSSWSTSFKYFSLGDIDILQNPQDIPYLENPNEFTLDGSYILKLNDYFSMGVTGRFLMSDVKLQSVDSDSSSANSLLLSILSQPLRPSMVALHQSVRQSMIKNSSEVDSAKTLSRSTVSMVCQCAGRRFLCAAIRTFHSGSASNTGAVATYVTF